MLLHYDDATLKELYFVRPQWLCDILAHVVTVREVNPFASNGTTTHFLRHKSMCFDSVMINGLKFNFTR